jgi:glycosyltransferase involved in cell wall biosynthesis
VSEEKNILVLTYFSFKDGLIQAYTLPYLKLIHEVNPTRKIFLLTKEKEGMEISASERLMVDEQLLEHNIYWTPSDYVPFSVQAILGQMKLVMKLFFFIRKHRVETLHCWGTPPGVEAFILSKLTGKRLIIDSFEPHAEAQVENGSWTRESLGYKVLWYFEKKMALHAETLIYTTRNMIQYAKERYGAYDAKELVKPACVNLDQFSKSHLKNSDLLNELGLTDKVVALYAGKFGGIYHDVEVFQYLKAASEFWPNKFAALIISPTPREEIESYCREVNLDPDLVISRFVPHEKIASYMGLADFALTPVRSVPTKKCCTPIKDGEYWALGLPVVITRDISDDSDLISLHKIGSVISDFSADEIKRSLIEINSILSQDKDELYARIRAIADRYRNFSIAEKIYAEIYS